MANQVLSDGANMEKRATTNYVNGADGGSSETPESVSRRLSAIDSRLSQVESGIKHLEILPKIHEVLCEMKRDLLEPAVGRKQMPLSIGIMMIAILGGLLIFREVKESSKDVTISAAGLKITSGEVVTKKTDRGAK